MASQSLYRKWRSQTFHDFVGQDAVIRTLKNALANNNPAHAYLFTGPRGTGKTSMARLLAKTINCASPVNGEPCNKCEQCREITAGNSFNVIEIDAASNRGIDSIRELRERVMVPPSTGKYKVYVLDEAHMLTTEAFNALLKTLEEPPDYAIFVLATTDVHKMLPTVLSRCQRFDFKRFTMRQIVDHLNFVAREEHVKIEKSAAELIARAAAGGMRDALSLLDQSIAYSGTEISLAQVQSMLGVADPRAIQKLIAHVAHLESPELLHLIHELSEAGADLRQINGQVGEYWRALMLAKAGADIATILDLIEDEIRDIQELLPLFSLEELTEFARIFAQNDLMQKNQGTPQLGLELAFLQCIEMHRRFQAGQSLTTSNQPQQIQARPAIVHPSPPVSVQPTTPPPTRVNTLPPVVHEDAVREVPGTVQVEETSVQQNGHDTAQSQGTSLTLEQVQSAWDKVKNRVKIKNSQTAALLNVFTVVGVEGTTEEAVIIIQSAHKFHHDHIQDNDRARYVDWALSMEFRQKCRVRLMPPGQSMLNVPLSPVSNSVAPAAPQPPVYRERPAETLPPPSPKTRKVEPPPSNGNGTGEPPLARKSGVRENRENGEYNTNTSSEILETPKIPKLAGETLKQKASQDPVVQEVVKTFGAKIADIRPKKRKVE